ncbi:MAG: CRISPR-associated endonuclease Cas3'', partial [Comamonadaceae bacterium]|nr:CRISPR-associated endonuclease Cas3'' [Comamonadaceae bacterium]
MPPPLPGYFSYWGKARAAPDGGARCHLLAWHALDVAAVGAEYLRRSPELVARVFRRSGLEAAQLERWLAFWLALHDLGKFSEAFQSQAPELFRALRQRCADPAKPYGGPLRHDSLGMLFWSAVLRERLVAQRWIGPQSLDLADGLDCWARACLGHHGQPPTEGDDWRQHYAERPDREAALGFVDAIRPLFLADDVVAAIAAQDPTAFWRASRELSWWV